MNLMHMCKRGQCVRQEENNLRHYRLGIDKADRTQDDTGTGAMMANHGHVCPAWHHQHCQCFLNCVFAQQHTETPFPETYTIPSYHFDPLEWVKKKIKECDKKKLGLFWPHCNRKISKEHKRGVELHGYWAQSSTDIASCLHLCTTVAGKA